MTVLSSPRTLTQRTVVESAPTRLPRLRWGGLGRCGRELCCTSFLTNFPAVNIRLAKEQNLALAGDKTSGVCGKTLCCLAFEGDFYKEQLRWLPRAGKRAKTKEGLEGRVIGLDVFRLTFTLLDGDRRRHVLPADAWQGNADREVPEPEICAPASASAIVALPGAGSRRPDRSPRSASSKSGSAPNASAAGDGGGTRGSRPSEDTPGAPRKGRDRRGRGRRRRRGKKDTS